MLKAFLALVSGGVLLANIFTVGPPGRVAGIDGGGAPGLTAEEPNGLNDTVAAIYGKGPPA